MTPRCACGQPAPNATRRWDNGNAAPRRVNAMRPLTPTLDRGEEGLAVQATRTCIIDGCGRPHLARGLCHPHYSKFTRQGTIGDYPPVRSQGRPPCTICGKPMMALGLCQMHYTRQLRTGTVDIRPYDWEAAATRFWAKVDRRADDECWPWLGVILHIGYGQHGIGGKRELAHRVAYELAVGPIPAGLQIDHVLARGCIRRDCVNPAHLEPVTARENVRRRAKR